MAYRLGDLADLVTRQGLPCAVDGDPDREVAGVATLEEAGPDEISFLANAKYEDQLRTTRAGAVIVARDQEVPPGPTALRTPDPYAAVTMVMVHICGFRRHPGEGIDPRAVIDPSARLGEGAIVRHGVTIESDVVIGRRAVLYPGCYVGRGCRIGDDCLLYPNVVLYEGTVLGDRVTVHAGTVIGEDGLGYAPVQGKWRKIPQIGVVEVGDDVEIGANCAIDRATLGRTVIGAGTKFSNLIAIGHGTRIGPDCLFVAQVGIAGSVTVGRHVTLAGKVGVAGHLKIGDESEIAAMSGVMRDVPPGSRLAGLPATPMKEAMRSIALVERLPELHRQIKRLEAEVAALRRDPERREG